MLYHSNGIQMCWYTPVFTRSDFRLSYFGDGHGREYCKITNTILLICNFFSWTNRIVLTIRDFHNEHWYCWREIFRNPAGQLLNFFGHF